MPFRLIGKVDVNGVSAEMCRGELNARYGEISYFGHKMPSLLAEVLAPFPDADLSWVEIVESAKVQPHVDHDIVTALNVYVTTAGAVTTFWMPRPNAEPFAFPGKVVKNRYKWSDIYFTGYFKAEPGEVYLLDVTRVHTVTSMTGLGVRTIMQATWKLPYSEIVKCISDN
jgi:hypothetical protein